MHHFTHAFSLLRPRLVLLVILVGSCLSDTRPLLAEDAKAGQESSGGDIDRLSPDDLLQQAQTHLAAGEPRKASAFLDKAIEKAPERYSLWMERARVHVELNEAIAAYRDYTQAVKLIEAMPTPDATAQQAQRDAATQLHTLGRTAGALLDLHASQGAELRQLAAELEAGDRRFSALRLYGVALQINPDDTVAEERVRALSAALGRVLAQTALGYGRKLLFDGKTLAGWRVRTGHWEADSEELKIRSGGAMYIFYEGPPMEDVVFEAEVKVNPRSYGYIMIRSTYEGAGYAFGIQRSESRNREGHVVDIRWSIQAHRNESITRTHRLFHEGSPAKLRIDPGRWYTVRLEARGKTITGYVNDQKWFEEEDATFPRGSVGLWGNHASYRNIRLERLPPQPRPTEPDEPENPDAS